MAPTVPITRPCAHPPAPSVPSTAGPTSVNAPHHQRTVRCNRILCVGDFTEAVPNRLLSLHLGLPMTYYSLDKLDTPTRSCCWHRRALLYTTSLSTYSYSERTDRPNKPFNIIAYTVPLYHTVLHVNCYSITLPPFGWLIKPYRPGQLRLKLGFRQTYEPIMKEPIVNVIDESIRELRIVLGQCKHSGDQD